MTALQERVLMMRGYSYAHFLLAGAERYGIPYAVYRVLEDGERYRAFFIPKSKTVVAIEALDSQRRARPRQHRWGHFDMQLWWIACLLLSAGVVIAGLAVGSTAVTLLGAACLLQSGLVARAYVRGG